MFEFSNKPDRHFELLQHLTQKWHMKNGCASVFLNEYRGSISKQYEKAYKQVHNTILSRDPDALEAAFNEIAEWALVAQAYHAYRSDLRAGKHAGTNIELVIWAILIVRIDLIESFDKAFSVFLTREHERRFPNLFQVVFNNPLNNGDIASLETDNDLPGSYGEKEVPHIRKEKAVCNDRIIEDSFTQIKTDYGFDVREISNYRRIEDHYCRLVHGNELSNFAKISLTYRLVAFYYLSDAKSKRIKGVLVAKGDLEWSIDLLSQSIDYSSIYEEQSSVEELAAEIDRDLVSLADFFGISRG